LLGADSFASHPLLKDVKLIMNFEARGNKGPSLLFETSPGNAALINTVVHSDSHPVGSSLFYSLYQLLPNDTDFTVFRRQKIPGLNFAFGENLEAYHSPLDVSSNLSLASLQHHGSYMLDLTRRFGGMDLATLSGQHGDSIFFDWFGTHLVAYPQFWVISGQLLITIELLIISFLYARRGEVKIARLLLACLFALLFLVVIPLVLAALEWLTSYLLGNSRIIFDSGANSFLLVSFVLSGACLGMLLFVLGRRHFRIHEFSLAGLFLVLGLSWMIALKLPAGSYLLFWPLFLMITGLLAATVSQHGYQRIQSAASVLAMTATLLLFAPLSYLLYIFLTLQLITILCIGLLIGAAFIVCIPFFELAAPQHEWRAGALALTVVSLASFVAGISLSRHSPSHPQRDTLIYSVNADAHKATLISYDRSLDEWTSKAFANKNVSRIPAPEYLGGSSWPVFIAPTGPLDLTAPTARIESDEREGSFRKLRMKINSSGKEAVTTLVFDMGNRPTVVRIGERIMPASTGSAPQRLKFFGFSGRDIELELTVPNPSKLSFWLLDQVPGLPVTVSPRTDNLIQGNGSDLTLICRKYDW
jgi:hypothetical protein